MAGRSKKTTRPKPKKCGATSKTSGQPCGQWARPGFDNCVYHGPGKQGGKQGGAPIQHGDRSMRFKRIQQEGADRIKELTEDAELLDLHRSVAASQYVMEEHAPVMPSADEIDARARDRFNLDTDAEPSQAQREIVQTELALIAQRMIRSHSQLQRDAARQQAEADLLIESALPIMRKFSEDIMRIVDDLCGPEISAQVRARFVGLQQSAVGELTEAAG